MLYKPSNILYNLYCDKCSPFYLITSALSYSFKRLSFANGWLWHSEVKLIGSSSLTTENWNTSMPFIKCFFFFLFLHSHYDLHVAIKNPRALFSYHWYTHSHPPAHTHTLEWKLIFKPAQCQGLLSMGEANLICLLLVKLFHHSTPDTIRGLSGLEAGNWRWKLMIRCTVIFLTRESNFISQPLQTVSSVVLLSSHLNVEISMGEPKSQVRH